MQCLEIGLEAEQDEVSEGANELKGKKKKQSFQKMMLLYGKNRNFKENRMMKMSYLLPERVAIPVSIFIQSRTTVVLLFLSYPFWGYRQISQHSASTYRC